MTTLSLGLGTQEDEWKGSSLSLLRFEVFQTERQAYMELRPNHGSQN